MNKFVNTTTDLILGLKASLVGFSLGNVSIICPQIISTSQVLQAGGEYRNKTIICGRLNFNLVFLISIGRIGNQFVDVGYKKINRTLLK